MIALFFGLPILLISVWVVLRYVILVEELGDWEGFDNDKSVYLYGQLKIQN